MVQKCCNRNRSRQPRRREFHERDYSLAPLIPHVGLLENVRYGSALRSSASPAGLGETWKPQRRTLAAVRRRMLKSSGERAETSLTSKQPGRCYIASCKPSRVRLMRPNSSTSALTRSLRSTFRAFNRTRKRLKRLGRRGAQSAATARSS